MEKEVEGIVLTVMVTESVLLQPVDVIVSVKIQMVDAVGVAVGFEDVELNPEGELDHEQVSPETEAAPKETEVPGQTVELEAVLADGEDFVEMEAIVVSFKLPESDNPFGFDVHILSLTVPNGKLKFPMFITAELSVKSFPFHEKTC